MKRLLLLLAVLLLLVVALTNLRVFYVVFGWVLFLIRVTPQMTFDWGSVAVGAVAVVLFTCGVHWLGRSWSRTAKPEPTAPVPRWRIRWSLSMVFLTLLLFVSGTALVGIVHQLAWLRNSGEPLTIPSLVRYDNGPSAQSNSLRRLGLAFHDYASFSQGSLPPGGTFAADGTMRHSWETHVLPFIPYDTRGIDMNRPWNTDVNRPYFESIIPIFINPEIESLGFKDANGFGLSHYAANVNVMAANQSLRFQDFTRGTENTILIGEVNTAPVAWGNPVNWRDPAIGLNRSPQGFGGPPGSGGVTFLMADGSVRFVSDKVSPDVLKALASPR
jgi:prepilin-type processing-associated H-X9-DG protein